MYKESDLQPDAVMMLTNARIVEATCKYKGRTIHYQATAGIIEILGEGNNGTIRPLQETDEVLEKRLRNLTGLEEITYTRLIN